MKVGSSRGMDTKRPRGSERSKPCHELQLTRRSQPPYPWPPKQAQPGVSKPCRTTAEAPGGLAREGPGELPTDRPLADRRGRPLGPRSPRSLRPGEALTITAQGGEIAFGALEAGLEVEYAEDSILAFTGPAARKATRSRAKGPANSSTTALSTSSSHTEDGDEAVLKAKRDTSSTGC